MTDRIDPVSIRPWHLPRWAGLALALFIVLIVIVASTGNFYVDVILGAITDGAVLLAWMLAGYGYGTLCVGWALPTAWKDDAENGGQCPPYADALLRHVSMIALGLGLIGLIVLGLGLAGFLSQITGIVVLLIGIIGALYAGRHHSFTSFKQWLTVRTPGSTIGVLLAFPLAVGIVAASISPGFLWKPLDPHPYDVVSYHLQIPREWYDAGKIIPLLHNSFSYFPMGMEMHDLLAMHLLGGPWKAMYLCQFMSLAFGVLTVLGVVGAVRSFGKSEPIAWLAGLATACVPWTTMLSCVAYVESGVMCYTLLAVVWGARALSCFPPLAGGIKGGVLDRDSANRSSMPPTPPSPARGEGEEAIFLTPHAFPLTPWLLACAFAAFACGMKYTAIPMTALPLLLFYPFFAGKRSIKPWLIGCALCGLLLAPWLIRNIVWAHNPVFPLATNIFGHAHFTPDQIDRYITAHEPPLGERSIGMRLFNAWHRIALDPQYAFLLLPLTVIAMLLSWRSLRLRFISFITIAMALIWLLATHDMPRFLTPAIPLATLLIGGVAIRSRLRQAIGGALLLALSVIGLGWTWNTLQPTLDFGRQGVFRMADMSVIETDETKAARTSGDHVALIGDAEAFFYVMPSDKLLYRGVFDVNIPPGVDTVDGWLGKSVDELRHEGYWVVINTAELNRLSETYKHIPKPAPPYDRVSPLPIVLPPIR